MLPPHAMSATTVIPTFSPDLLGKHAAYVQELSRKYNTLSKLVLDQPPSPSHSPPELDEGRRRALCERVREAWATAQGNPADGKWVFLTQLIRMGCTSGRRGRWLGARMDVKCLEEPNNCSGWLLTTSEAEWIDWERKYNQVRMVRAKVESWKRRVDSPREEPVRAVASMSQVITGASRPPEVITGSPDGKERSQLGKSSSFISLKSSGGTTKRKTSVKPTDLLDPLKDAAPFGFGVVKRLSQTSVQNEKLGAPGKRKLLGKDVSIQPVPEIRQKESSNSQQSRQGEVALPTTVATKDLNPVGCLCFLPF